MTIWTLQRTFPVSKNVLNQCGPVRDGWLSLSKHPFVHDPLTTTCNVEICFTIFSTNPEAAATEFLENIEKMIVILILHE